MISIVLPAKRDDDLSWKQELHRALAAKESGEKILWVFDLGIDPVRYSFTDEAIFAGQALALTTFSKFYPQFAESTIGVVLARSSVFRELDEKDECEKLEHLDEPFKTHLCAMTLFADYLHRLASFLPDEVKIQVFFDPKDAGEIEQKILLSKERFRHLEIATGGISIDDGRAEEAIVGYVLPEDGFCGAKTREELEEMLSWLKQKDVAFRCIPEMLLNEEWTGLEMLVFFAPAMTKLGRRMAQGFIAAGGKVIYYPNDRNLKCAPFES